MPARNLFILIGTLLAGIAVWTARGRDLAGSRFNEVLAVIDRAALEPAPPRRLFEAAVEAAVAELDEHSAYIPPAEQEGFEALLDQEFGGVGLELAQDEPSGDLVVVSPVVSGPAWQAGIVAGDRIIAIDGRSTRGLSLAAVVGLLRGPVSTAVTLRVVAAPKTLDPATSVAPDGSRDVRLVRALVTTDTVLGDRRRADGTWEFRLEDDPGIALVRITSFGERTVAELDAALDALETAPLRGILLDLRGNPGGLLSAAVAACDRFLESGVIVATRGRRSGGGEPAPEFREATPGAAFPDVPVAVLIDGLTASAAEIVAASLQDHGRAAVVGSRTFGKGTVQSVVPLSGDDGLLKLTTAEYLRPRGATLHRRTADGDAADWGVVPDRGYEVTPPAASLERLRKWRRQRDSVGGAGRGSDAGAARPLAAVDDVVAAALDAIRRQSAAGKHLSGEKEAAGHADEAVPARE